MLAWIQDGPRAQISSFPPETSQIFVTFPLWTPVPALLHSGSQPRRGSQSSGDPQTIEDILHRALQVFGHSDQVTFLDHCKRELPLMRHTFGATRDTQAVTNASVESSWPWL